VPASAGATRADREQLQVELVDETGAATGMATVGRAHAAPGLPHRAFSVLLFDADGRVLLQQRAAAKIRFGARWSNTCCGHPAPGQDVAAAAAVRLADELGLAAGAVPPLTEAGVYRYRATDDGSGHVEDEWDHVLIGRLAGGGPAPDLAPDPAEVADWAWVEPGALRRGLARQPGAYTPWCQGVLEVAAGAGAAAAPTAAVGAGGYREEA
jgi:isopentenyl-diphosphate Delta-isomerase